MMHGGKLVEEPLRLQFAGAWSVERLKLFISGVFTHDLLDFAAITVLLLVPRIVVGLY